MKKTKKAFVYLSGALLAFALGKINAFAQMAQPLYGIQEPSTPMILGRIFIFIISPIIILLALIVGIIIFIKRKRKNDQKDS